MAEPTINISANSSTDVVQPILSYAYNYEMPMSVTYSTDGTDFTPTEVSFVAQPYEYGVNNFSMRYGYKKIDWKWYQPIKNWLKFNLKVLFS